MNDRTFARRLGVWLLGLVFAFAGFGVAHATPGNSDDVGKQIARHLDSGEFSLALALAHQLDGSARDDTLAKIAQYQMIGGARYGALDSAASIGDEALRSQALSDLHENSGQPGAQGGITAADFAELISLIQNIIEPESWDTEGPAIRPYPAGVYVDAQGALKRIQPSALADTVDRALTRDNGNREVAKASELRKISLTKLERNLQRLAAEGRRPTDDMKHLAGLYRIEYLMVDPQTNEIIIAGPAGPMIPGADGQRINRDTRQPVVLLDDLVQCLRNAWFHQGRLGCSIDPRQANLAATQQFLGTTRTSGEEFRNQLRDTMGWQDITVHGLDPDSHAAQTIVEADYLMKCIGLGVEPSIAEVPAYWDRIDNQKAPATGLEVARWWFTMNYDGILTNDSQTVFRLQGQGVKVLSENELLAQNGQRIHTGQTHGPTESFARDFTQHFDALCAMYPSFGQLRNVFDAALVATLIRNRVLADKIDWEGTFFCGQDSSQQMHFECVSIPPAHQVMSVVNHTTFDTKENGRKLRHTVVGVGGGVEFDAVALLRNDVIKVASPGEQLDPSALSDVATGELEQWWWD